MKPDFLLTSNRHSAVLKEGYTSGFSVVYIKFCQYFLVTLSIVQARSSRGRSLRSENVPWRVRSSRGSVEQTLNVV